MAMRLSGLISGMDTESLIGQLVDARKTKVTKVKKQQMKANVKQDAWKDLNTKLKNLQSKYLSNLRFASTYSKKTTKVSNPNAVSVITGENAVNGVQSLEINQLAKTGYLTGAELKKMTSNSSGDMVSTDEKGEYTAMTKLSELGLSTGGSFNVTVGKNSVDINVDENSTISDVLSKLKDAGLNASFDVKSQRIFVSAKESGLANDFSITANDGNGAGVLSALGLETKVSEDSDKATWNRYKGLTVYENGSYRAKTAGELANEINKGIDDATDSYLNQYKSLKAQEKAANDEIVRLKEKYGGNASDADINNLNSASYYETLLNGEDGTSGLNAQIKAAEEALAGDALTESGKANCARDLETLKEQAAEASGMLADRKNYDAQQAKLAELSGKIGDVEAKINVTSTTEDDGTITYSATAKESLEQDVKAEFAAKAAYAEQALNAPVDSNKSYATKVNAQDAEITLNGAKFTNSTNVFEINGLTFTALSETKAGESITVTTQNDTDGIYDMVKNFLKEYNKIINEMDKLYNAASAKGYEPLTNEEKDAMSDSEVEEWEKKIKDSILRRDENLSSISGVMKEAMMAGYEIGGKKMYLSDFGINTLGYFSAPDNEKNAYHIDGDPDDSDTAGNADKLKAMIASDPDTVISFFTKMAQNLYDKMSEKSKSVDGYRSFGSFYDDKKMKKDYDDYTSKISDMEKKLNDYEDQWYRKFAKMESTMAKMQSKTSALSGLLGGN